MSRAGILPAVLNQAGWTPALLFAAVLFSTSGGSLHAQTPRAPEQAFHFTVFSVRPVEGVAFSPSVHAAAQKLVFYPTARSPRYEYRGVMPLRFTDASGAVVAEATVPPEMRDVLLLFSAVEPAPSTGLRYQVAVLDDGTARHGPGGLAIINFSGLALSGTVGATAVTLKDGLNPTMPVGRAAKIMLRTSVKGKSYQSYSGVLELKAGERALLILYPPYYKASPEVQSRLLVDEPPASLAPARGR